MKLKTVCLSLLAILTINTFAQKKPTKIELDASKTIQFGNSVIDLGNSYSQTLKNYQSLLKSADNNMERIKKNPNLTPHFINCNVITVQANHQSAYVSALKAAPIFPEKADIQKYVAEGENNIKSVGLWCAELSTYNSNKEYQKDADFTKYRSICDSLNHYLEKASNSWRQAGKQASVAGNRAELILLEGSHIASFVIPMKKDLIALGEVFSMFSTDNPDVEAIKSALTTIDASIEKNKDISTKDVSKLSDVYYKDVYKTFYNKCSSCVKSLNTVTDRLQEKPIDERNINSWFSSASTDYSNVIEEYNTFVSQ